MSGHTSGTYDFAEVARTEIDNVYRYLLHVTRDPVLADDLTSSTFERALRQWKRFDPRRGRPRTWLVEIARTQFLDHHRSTRRRRAREEQAAVPDAHDGGVGHAHGFSAELREALELISATEREIIALRVVLDVSTAETAAILDMTPSAVSTGLHRALTRLRSHLENGDR